MMISAKAGASNQQLHQQQVRKAVKRAGGKTKSAGGGKSQVIRYYCSFTNTIADVLSSRGWKEVEEDEEWDFVWADREWIYSVFDKMHLENWQRLNHYRNGRELCRKDLMAKNMKKKRRALEKEGRYEEAAAYDFIPTTFVLPREYRYGFITHISSLDINIECLVCLWRNSRRWAASGS